MGEEPFLWKTNTEEYGEEEVLLKYGINLQGICTVDFHEWKKTRKDIVAGKQHTREGPGQGSWRSMENTETVEVNKIKKISGKLKKQ